MEKKAWRRKRRSVKDRSSVQLHNIQASFCTMVARALTRDDRRQLAKWMKHPSIDLQLLYSASRDGCSGAAFHQKCDGQGATVSVGYTSDGYVYGGYTSINFASSGSWKPDSRAFLFRLKKAGRTDYMVYPAANAHIYCQSNYGPAFGSPSAFEMNFFSGGSYEQDSEYFALNNTCALGSGYEAFDSKNQSATDIAGTSTQFSDIEVYKVTDLRQLEPEQAWRKIAVGWSPKDLERLQLEVSGYRPPIWLKAKQANILLIGQVGAGKSSFCNTVNSLFRGHVTAKAACGSSERSLTTTFRKYEFRDRIGGKSLRFRLCDTMGLEEGHNLDSINFPYLLDGNIPDRFQFNPTNPISPSAIGYIAEPKLKDKMHVVAIVIDGSTVNLLSGVLLDKLKAIRVLVNQRGIPLMILMTKVDKLDQLVSDHLQNIYLSVDVRDTVEELSNKTGVPMSYIMPVKSYERETELESSIDILALTALRQMLRVADDFFEDQMDKLGISPGCGSSSDDDDDEDRKGTVAVEEKDAALATNLNPKDNKNRQKHTDKNIL